MDYVIGVIMVRINLVEPELLADQHLNAEYHEILMLFGYYRKNKVVQTSEDNLKHPIQFYKNKLLYLKKRFNVIVKEKEKRGFKSNKNIINNGFSIDRYNDFKPEEIHINRIKERIKQRIKERPNWYRYYGKYKEPEFFENLLNDKVKQKD